MASTLMVNFDRPIISASILENYCAGSEPSGTGAIDQAANTRQVGLTEDSKEQKSIYDSLCQTLQQMAAKVTGFYNDIFSRHKEEIARLSLEIARKVLMQKVSDGDYEIESIIKEALQNVPAHEGLVVHLNPEDLASLQKAQQQQGNDSLAGIKLVADNNIGCAECLVESPKGIIKSLIDEHLNQITQALTKTE